MVYLPKTMDELYIEFHNFSMTTLKNRYQGNVIRVLEKPKDWKALVIKEWDGINYNILAQKYNVSIPTIKRILTQHRRKR